MANAICVVCLFKSEEVGYRKAIYTDIMQIAYAMQLLFLLANSALNILRRRKSIFQRIR